MVSGGKRRSRSLYQYCDVTDNAPRGNLPTSLLNHETSDHLLSRYEAKTLPYHRGAEYRVRR